MKVKTILAVVLTGVLALSIAGCGAKTDKDVKTNASSTDKTITIGVSPVPHKGIVEAAVPELEAKGYTVEVKEFTDYVIPNTALDSGELDANFFQHTPYLNEFNEKNGTKIKSLGAIHLEPLGAYSKKVKDIKELKDGATIAIPNDPSNEARALRLLEAALLPTVVDEVDLAVINGNYALEVFNPSKDALVIEDKDSEASKPYGNVLAVKDRKSVV